MKRLILILCILALPLSSWSADDDWRPKGGPNLGLSASVSGGGVTYTLKDDFSIDVAAGQFGVSPNEKAVPGPGTRTVVDSTANHLLTTGGALSVTGWTTAGDPGVWYGGLSRTKGRMSLSHINFSAFGPTGGSDWVFGYDNNQGGGIGGNPPYFDNTTSGLLRHGDGTNSPQINTLSLSTDYYLGLILRTTGSFAMMKIGSYWYLLRIEDVSTTATLYPTITSIRAATYTSNYLRIPTLLWTPRPLSADDFGGTYPTLDNAVLTLTGLEAYQGATKTWENGNAPNPTTWSNSLGFAVNAPVGTEGVSNNEFTTNTTGWSPVDDSTIARVDSTTDPGTASGGSDSWCGKVTAGSTGYYSSQTPSPVTNSNTFYRVSCKAYAPSANDKVNAARITLSATAGASVSAENSWQSLAFIAKPSASRSVLISAGTSSGTFTSGDVAYFDSVSCKALPLNQLLSLINTTGTPDVYVEVDITTCATGFQAGVGLNWDSPTNPTNGDLIYLNMNDGKVYWDKCVNGTWANYTSGSGGTGLTGGSKLAVRKIGTSTYVWYNNAYINSYTTVNNPATTTPTYHGMFQTGSGATETKLDNWKCYGVGSNGEYNLLNSFIN